MAEGVRIRPTRPVPAAIQGRGRVVVVSDLARPLPPPADGQPLEAVLPNCSVCNPPMLLVGAPAIQHFHKTYHITLADDDTAVVSTGVWEALSRMVDRGGFEAVNPVPSPPKQIITFSDDPARGGVRLVEKVQQPILTVGKS